MAKRLERFEPAATRYPWDRWTNGSAYRVKQGSDFHCSIIGFVSQLYKAALSRGLTVVTTQPESGVVDFQFSKKPKAESSKKPSRRSRQVATA